MRLNKHFTRQAWVIFGPLKWRLLFVLGMIFAGQGLQLVGPYVQGAVIDGLNHGQVISDIYWLIGLAGGVWLIQHWIFQYLRERYEVNKVDYDVDERASDQTIVQMTRLSIGQHAALHSGLKMSVANRGQNSMVQLVNLFIFEIVPTASRALLMTAAMCWLSLTMGSIVFVAIFSFVALTLWINSHFAAGLKKQERMWNRESKFRNEIIQNIGHVLVNAQENKARREADAKYAEAVAYAKPMWQKFLVLAYFRSMVLIGARIAVMLLGAYYIYQKQYSLGTIVIFWSWSGNALDGFWSIGSTHRTIIRQWSSIRRYCEFLEVESDVKVVSNPVRLGTLRGEIELRNVSFSYNSRVPIGPEDEEEDFSSQPEKSEWPALKDVSVAIKPGETIAIVGESGSGKTTLVNLLMRSGDPTTGQVLIDGQDLRVLDLHDFRLKVGVVEQHVPLFDRSIRENILYDLNGQAENVTAEELERVAQISQISRFAHKLEKGFDTLIGERGIKLSGGERQRVGIARALIKNPAILIFDEATSSLDAAIEAEIREAINEASRGRTTIIIAHRFSTIRYANRIIVMDEGRIVGQGKHDELYQVCEPYRRLVDHQVTGGIVDVGHLTSLGSSVLTKL